MTPIYCALLCDDSCNSATFTEKFDTCVTFFEKFYNSTVSWTKDPDWSILYRSEELIQYDDWTLVFRGQSLVNASFYSLWTAVGYHDDLPLSSGFPIGCYRMDNMDTFTNGQNRRRMAIAGTYAGCNNDTTYYLTIDTFFEGCTANWSLTFTGFPLFVYSPLDRIARLSFLQYSYADVMAVFVKMKST
ncbi:hypothetical protein Btru_052641 [Bulinus truncatus]|nr:hypothetical protein Btru_052641 [Bulinus truncatus]